MCKLVVAVPGRRCLSAQLHMVHKQRDEYLGCTHQKWDKSLPSQTAYSAVAIENGLCYSGQKVFIQISQKWYAHSWSRVRALEQIQAGVPQKQVPGLFVSPSTISKLKAKFRCMPETGLKVGVPRQ